MKITLDTRIYPLEAIMNACYAFIDRAYVSLDRPSKETARVDLKDKKTADKNAGKNLKEEFLNELLHSSVRYQISKNNRKIREYIVGRALYSPVLSETIGPDGGKELDYLEDPLGIAIPWEKKYGKKKKKHSAKTL
ncbi:MAG TPA: His-Xaa-Ser system protein HxsD [Candidatus Omnitrophica bacterium]|nr:His-Xaa-Ser system protein HxsD [Candidatus Omnitrophota bacterium]